VLLDLRAVSSALTQSELTAAVSKTRIAASDTRALADLLRIAAPDAARHLQRAGDSLDESTSALNRGEFEDASYRVGQAMNEIDLAVPIARAAPGC
jgi:hypothetical protein